MTPGRAVSRDRPRRRPLEVLLCVAVRGDLERSVWVKVVCWRSHLG